MNFVSRFFVPGLFEPYKVQSAKVQITPYTFELCRVQKAKAWTILNFVGWLGAFIAVLGPRNPQNCCATVLVLWGGCIEKIGETWCLW